jgi:hypothetical protein
MNCACIICIVLLWLIPHPIVIWLTCGSMECNKDVFMYTPEDNHLVDTCSYRFYFDGTDFHLYL